MAHSIRLDSTSQHGTPTKNGKKTMDAGALKDHIDRKGNYANQENIDPTKTGENYSLDDWDNDLGYYERAEELRKTAGINEKRDFRQGVSFSASFVITASKEDMDTLTAAEQREYFETAKEWLDDYFGSDTLLYADVHMDEKTPHLHIGYLPINEDTRNLRWDSKIKRGTMSQKFQKDLPQALTDAGFDFDMPKDKTVTEAQHVDPKTYAKIESAYKNHIKDDVKNDIQDDFVPKYKAQVEKVVMDEVIAANDKAIADMKANEASALLAKTQLDALKRKKDALEADKKAAEAEATEARTKAQEASDELTELNKGIADVNNVIKARDTLRDVLVDTGVNDKVATALASGRLLPTKSGGTIDARGMLRHKVGEMSLAERTEFANNQRTKAKQDKEMEL